MIFPSDNGEFIIRSDTYDGDTNFPEGDAPYDNIIVSGSVFHSTDQYKFGASSIKFSQKIANAPSDNDYINIQGSPTSYYNNQHIDFWFYIPSSAMTLRNNNYNGYIIKTSPIEYLTPPYEYTLSININAETIYQQTPYLTLYLSGRGYSISKTIYNTVVDTWIHVYMGIAQIYQSGTNYKTSLSLGINGDVITYTTPNHEYISQLLSSSFYLYGIPGYVDQVRFFNFDNDVIKIYTEDFIPYEIPYPIYTSSLASSILNTSSILNKVFDNYYQNIVHVNSDLTYNKTQYSIVGNVKEFKNLQYTNYKDCKIFVYDVLSGNLAGVTTPNIDGEYIVQVSSNNNMYMVCVNTNSNNLYSSLIKNNITPNIYQ